MDILPIGNGNHCCNMSLNCAVKQVQEGTLVVTPPKWTCFEGLSSTTLSKLAGVARLAYESTMRSETVLCDLPERIQTLGMSQN